MGISFCSFSSGSSGNCYLIKNETTAILVDAGISGKKILEGLRQTETPPEIVKAVLITHEHTDHVKGLSAVLKKLPCARPYANEATWEAVCGGRGAGGNARLCRVERGMFHTGGKFFIDDILVRTFPISHDAADPVGFSFFFGNAQISIVADTGYVTETIYREILEADLLVLESNHDVDMLKMCSYPWKTKQRILGEKGHLSNEDAGSLLCRLLAAGRKKRRVLLTHMSKENNFPEMAIQTIRNCLLEEEFYIGRHIEIEMVLREEISPLYRL